MIQASVVEAKSHLSELINQARLGEDVIVTSHGKAVAQIIPLCVDDGVSFGFMKNAFTMPDDFNSLMQDDIVAMFEDSAI